MASEQARVPDDHIPYPNELDPPLSGGNELPPLTSEDIAHAVERLQAGRESGEYTGMRESDLAVLAHLTVEQWHDVQRDPFLLPRILAPKAHA